MSPLRCASGSEPPQRGGYLCLFVRSTNTSFKLHQTIRSARARGSLHVVGLACRAPLSATARSLGGRFWKESGDYLSVWSPTELWVLLTAKGKGILSESPTSVHSRVQRFQLSEGLASNVSKQPSLPIEVNFLRLFPPRDESFGSRWCCSFSVFREVWGCLLPGAYSVKYLLWGNASAAQRRESESHQNRLSAD